MNANPKKVLIGTVKYHPKKVDVDGHRNETTGDWVPVSYIPSRYEWIDSGRKGLLYDFFVEDNAERTVVGLVELTDGQFDTFAAACLKLETPTAI